MKDHVFRKGLLMYGWLQMTELFGDVAHRMPLQLVEPVEKMINKDIRYRPTAQLFMLVRSTHRAVNLQCTHNPSLN